MTFKALTKFILLSLLSLIVSSCGNKSKSSSSSAEMYSPAGPVVLSGDVSAYQWLSLSHDGATLVTTKPSGPTYTYALSNKPTWLSVDANTGVLSGIPDSNEVFENIILTATNTGTSATYARSFSLASIGDPLIEYAWHFNNTGQKAFASFGGDSSTDANIDSVYRIHDVTGSGIKVAISDSGGEINHDDLYENIISGASKDYTREGWTGYPTPSSAHGTAVGGLIAAKGWNNIGSMGVAPNAKIAIFQFLESPQSTDILIDQASGDFDIFNYSYGDSLLYDTQSNPTYIDHLRSRVLNGRNGLGPIFLKAAGNEYALGEGGVCGTHNANAPLENEAPWIMVIGAVNANGKKSSYASVGSNIWVSAPAGEYGSAKPALITTDLPTCFKGYSKATSGLNNSFEYGHSLNEKCNYTSIMNGTSGATPVVSGVVALMLEANPDLSWRDVKHILAMTADNTIDQATSTFNHPSSSFANCTNITFDSYTYDRNWVTNNATPYAVKYSNSFGFGLVNAKLAVDMAKNFALDPMNWLPLPFFVELNANFTNGTYTNSSSISIPDATNGAGSTFVVGSNTSTINIASSILVETVQIKVNITHPISGQIGLELDSPSGTKSIMLNVNNSFLIDGDSDLNMILTSQAFYGESATGNWTLRVIDGAPGQTGQLNSWDINIIGHN